MQTEDLVIDPEFRDLIPPLSTEERQQLQTNIVAANGCRDALVAWNNTILDGHNRYEICVRLGLPFRVEEIQLPGRNAAKIWIIRNQFGRRNLIPYVRAELALKLEPLVAEKAKENQRAMGGPLRQKSDEVDTPISTKHELAHTADVSHDTIHKVKTITELGTKELRDAARRGNITINSAAKVAKMKPDDQKKIVEKLSGGSKRTAREEIKAYYKKEKEERKNAPLSVTIPIDDRLRIIHAGIESLCQHIDPASIDWIVTDPPYPKDFLGVYEELAKAAKVLLKPGGGLLMMIGQSYLPDILAAMTRHIRYHWTVAYLTPGGQSVQVWDRQVNTFWKPVVWFQNDAKLNSEDWVGDVTGSKTNDNNAGQHHWGQSESGMADIIHRFTFPGQRVLDPFLGGGTTGVVCVRTGRLFIGADVDATAVSKSTERLMAELSSLRKEIA